MITSVPAIMGYSRERLILCGKIVMQLRDREKERKFLRLIKQPRTAIDAVATARLVHGLKSALLSRQRKPAEKFEIRSRKVVVLRARSEARRSRLWRRVLPAAQGERIVNPPK